MFKDDKIEIDDEGYWHLLREMDGISVELTEGMKCRWILNYPNGDWDWMGEDEDEDYHLMREIDGKWVHLN